jgi:hypothetical protein
MFNYPLVRDVTVVLVIKTIIVIAAALFVFGPSQRPHIDAAAVDARLMTSEVPTP